MVKVKSKPTKEILTKLDVLTTLLQKKDELAHKQSIKPLNFVEAAQYLSLSHSTLYKLTYQRKIPCHKPNGKYLYFFKHELDEWISGDRNQKSSPHSGIPLGEDRSKNEEGEEETEADGKGARKEAG